MRHTHNGKDAKRMRQIGNYAKKENQAATKSNDENPETEAERSEIENPTKEKKRKDKKKKEKRKKGDRK